MRIEVQKRVEKTTQCKHMQTHTPYAGWKGESKTEREEEKTDK